MHNKLAAHRSVAGALESLHALSRTPQRNKYATALEALTGASSTISSVTTRALSEKYGDHSVDEALADEVRLSLKTIIYQAWRSKGTIATKIVDHLACFEQGSPKEVRGQIELKSTKCNHEIMCSVQQMIAANLNNAKKLRDAVVSSKDKPENQRRAKALKEIMRKPKSPINDHLCRSLGDAVFAFCAPEDAIILTTNITDHAVLAESLGKIAQQAEYAKK